MVHHWMDSPGHRGNILNASYQVEGIGFARSRKQTGRVDLTLINDNKECR